MKHNTRTAPVLSLALMVVFALFVPAAAHAQINYQGRLTDSVGAALPDGQYAIEFSLWTDATGGSQIWGPFTLDGSTATGHGPLADLVGSRFNVIIGSQDETGLSLTEALAAPSTYLQIKVGADAPITPRQIILPAPRSLRADVIPNVTPSANGVDVAGDLAVSGNVVLPSGDLVLQGGNVGLGLVPAADSVYKLDVDGTINTVGLKAGTVSAMSVSAASVAATSISGTVNGEKPPLTYYVGHGGTDTTRWDEIQIEGSIIESYLGDENGGTVRFLIRVNNSDEVRILDWHFYVEQVVKHADGAPEIINQNTGLRGFWVQGDNIGSFTLDTATKNHWCNNWNWVYMSNYRLGSNGRPGLDPPGADGESYIGDDKFKVSIATVWGISATIIIYDR